MTTLPFGSLGWTPARLSSLTTKTFLITGANSGTGFEASKILLSKGAKVIMLNRNPHKSAEAIASLKAELGSHIDVDVVHLDLGDLEAVRLAAQMIKTQVTQIDGLLCNGAIAQVASLQKTKDGFESQLGVNHFGHFLLCGLLFDLIAKAQGRIVVVGSNAYKMGLKTIQFDDLNFEKNYTAWNAYAQSKLAQMMFAYELQRRLSAKNSPVQVHVCHPGASKTNLLKDTASSFNKALWAVLSRFIAQSAHRGAWPEVMCATDKPLAPYTLYGPTKRADTVGPVGECKLDPLVLDHSTATRLWQVSELETGFKWSL